LAVYWGRCRKGRLFDLLINPVILASKTDIHSVIDVVYRDFGDSCG
jgi:hypothetical protein